MPQGVAFVRPGTPGFVSFDGNPDDASSYWNRTEDALAKEGKVPFHKAIGLSGTGRDALFDFIKQGVGTESERHINKRGVFVFLRGDSHLRIVFSMLLMTLSGDPAVIEKAK